MLYNNPLVVMDYIAGNLTQPILWFRTDVYNTAGTRNRVIAAFVRLFFIHRHVPVLIQPTRSMPDVPRNNNEYFKLNTQRSVFYIIHI